MCFKIGSFLNRSSEKKENIRFMEELISTPQCDNNQLPCISEHLGNRLILLRRWYFEHWVTCLVKRQVGFRANQGALQLYKGMQRENKTKSCYSMRLYFGSCIHAHQHITISSTSLCTIQGISNVVFKSSDRLMLPITLVQNASSCGLKCSGL